MNCMEAQALVEDALDESLAGSRRRALDLHLSRCDACRAFFAAEREEHRRWFRAMNEPEARCRLPEGFAEEFLASLAHDKAVPQKRWAFVGMFRRIAAVLTAILLFAGLSYAAAVAVNVLGGDESNHNQETAGGESSNVAASSEPVSISEDASSADTTFLGESFSGGTTFMSSEFHNQPTGGNAMTKRKAAAAALSVAMAAAPLAAADGEAYQYIISTPYPEANVYHSSASVPTMLDSGALRVAGVAKELEARSRSGTSSVAIALNALEFKTFIITVR